MLTQLKAGLTPEAVGVSTEGQQLEVRWPAKDDPTGEAHTSIFDAGWLRAHCYSSGAGSSGQARDDETTPWAAADIADALRAEGELAFEYSTLIGEAEAEATRGGGGKRAARFNEEHTLGCLRAIKRYGFAMVRGTPNELDATKALARHVGLVQPTLYGTFWDTAPREESGVMDTAYSNAPLPLHTDGCYLEHAPGLQLFHCVEQPPITEGDPLAGATRLADGLMAAAVLESEHPRSFDFFTRVPLPFQHREGETHLAHLAPILSRHPLTSEVIGFRFNETDRAPLDCLSHDDVGAFYEHVKVLHAVLQRIETAYRLRPGEAILINNHRVLHGRHGFVGRRNMLGCYLTADDWQSRLRVLERRAELSQK